MASCHPPLTQLSRARSADFISLGADCNSTPNEMSGGSFDPTLATSPLWGLIGGGKRSADEEAWQPCSSQPCKARAPLTCSACQAAHYCSRFVDSLCKFIHITSVIREHQRAHWPKHKSSCAPFTLRNSATRGRHLVASRAIARGEVILEVFFTLPKLPLFVDVATFRSLQSQLGHSSTHLLSVLVATSLPPYLGPGEFPSLPRSIFIFSVTRNVLFGCNLSLPRCSQCGWPVCGPQCEEKPIHRAECKVGTIAKYKQLLIQSS